MISTAQTAGVWTCSATRWWRLTPRAANWCGTTRWCITIFGHIVIPNIVMHHLVWYYQMVHHDIWDYDMPAQPVLITVRRDSRDIPAIAQLTKMGFVFILDRLTGKPLFPVEE